ncbi:polysaccharide pyruvyl transferase family protein [Brevibacterium sp. UCMA 11752]|uniref:polysaccharide pyruvyl transferase family protein n=1 Tax=Brevibacterium sp. UCMA 11752 TaxID=2745946 RepID=UPI001F1CE4A1|nr:polysaccharide pyruvyl transferase family protein [Brevibacterium sp. UCMA 11752]MCF2587202.1 polysaccharide pyruvyl transferase family protein [Brevibacterium sp. UCMA 11752]
MKKTRILLLTNRDSDNVGDQIIEASVISLLKTVATNLRLDEDSFEISSRAAGIISKKYLKTGDESLLLSARKAISNADLLIFGGAPLFNYKYQSFYRRTIRTVELAQEYGVPTLFSSIGVEPYSEDDPRSQALKKALNLPVVRQITTRDDLQSVLKYVEGSQISTSLVADPAVFADRVFEKVGELPASFAKQGVPTIGLVVTRGGIFADNSIDFSERDQQDLWLGVIKLLEERGYGYRLFTTGHFTDEIFLDSLVRQHGVPGKNVTFAVNSPDELIHELRKCTAVIAYRLHASITSFALGTPSVGLSWNFKVTEFYKEVGYAERAISPDEWNPRSIVSAVEAALNGGVEKDDNYLYTVYATLFAGVKGVLSPNEPVEPYSLDEVVEALPRSSKTPLREYRAKVQRKLRRSYDFYANQTKAHNVVAKKARVLPRVQRVQQRMKRMLRKVVA